MFIFVSDFAGIISSQLSIKVYDATVCLSSMSDKVKLTVAIENDLLSVVNCGKQWLVHCNEAFKIKLILFSDHREDFLPSINLSGPSSQESNPSRLHRFTFAINIKWSNNSDSVATLKGG